MNCTRCKRRCGFVFGGRFGEVEVFCCNECRVKYEREVEYADKAFKEFEDIYPIENRFEILDL